MLQFVDESGHMRGRDTLSGELALFEKRIAQPHENVGVWVLPLGLFKPLHRRVLNEIRALVLVRVGKSVQRPRVCGRVPLIRVPRPRLLGRVLVRNNVVTARVYQLLADSVKFLGRSFGEAKVAVCCNDFDALSHSGYLC